MASIQRTRSLRRPPSASTEIPPGEAATGARNASPSRLPVKFHTRTRSTVTTKDAVASSSSAAASSATTRTRPASAILARSSAAKTNTTSSNSSQEPTKRETSRYPPSTTLTRQQPSSVRPGSSGSAAPVKRAPSHKRAKSTTAAASSSTVHRPPSRDQGTVPTTRANVSHRRNPSSERSNANNAVHTPTKPSAPALQPRLRPAFSTLQQHYSPAKSLAPKPLTATYLAPPSPSKLPANVAASAETNRLQAELLQLHLLHRDAAVVEEAWRKSAKQKLGARVAKLEEAAREVEAMERDRAEAENVLALRKWAAEGVGLDQKIQALDTIVNGVWALSDPGGRYARTVRRFERWVDRVSEIEEARRSGTALLQGSGNLFISEVETPWKEEFTGLTRKLHAWQQQLSDLGEIPPAPEDGSQPASLIRMLRGCGSLVREMLAELTTMEEMEREALEGEEDWIERVNREDEDDDTPRAGAIWRSFNGR